jgi:tetratricopeptide (TPR) repeat protein
VLALEMLFHYLMRLFLKSHLVMTFLIFTLCSAKVWSSDRASSVVSTPIQLKTQGDTLSFELTGQNDWNYDLKRSVDKNQTKVLLTVKGIESENYDRIKNIKNPFITGIKVIPNGVDGKKQIEFTLSSNKVETFDYLTDYPSKLIVDFYFNESFKTATNNGESDDSGASASSLSKAKSKTASADGKSPFFETAKQKAAKIEKAAKKGGPPLVGLAHKPNPLGETAEDRQYAQNFKNDEFDEMNKVGPIKQSSAKIQTKVADRNPANDYLEVEDFNSAEASSDEKVDLKAGLFGGTDDQLNRFKLKSFEMKVAAAHKAAVDYFISYPVLDRPFGFWTKMKENAPEYEIQPEKTEENKQIRLIKKLYDKKRTLVLRQTTEWFANKYPDSKYLEIAYAMTGDSFMEAWKNEKKGQDYETAQLYYKKLMDNYPQSALFERTSLASGFYDLDKQNYLTAIRKFKMHSDNPQFKDKNSKHFAELGMAYCLAKLNKVEEAIKLAEDVENASSDPQTKAEAAFRKGDFLMFTEKYMAVKNQYAEATKKYPQFVKKFPNAVFNKMEALFRVDMNLEAHAAALEFMQNFPRHEYAPYAMTRLGELLEILGSPQEKAVGAYLETHFRYGDSPKTIVARLHLLSTRMKGMKEIELKNTIAKMNELAQKSDLENIEQFKTTMISDGFVRRKEFDEAIKTLVTFYQEFPSKKNSEQVTNRIKSSIHNYIQYLSENDNHKNVLKVYKQYADNWIRKQERSDTFYYLGKAYQSAGAYGEALKKYDLAEQKLLGERSPASIFMLDGAMPKIEKIYLTQAQSLFEQNNLQGSEQVLDKIKNPDNLSVPEQIARVNLASRLYEKRGDNDTAIRYLSEVIRVWKSAPDLVADSAIRVAKLWNKVEKPQKGIEILDGLLQEKVSTNNTRKIYRAKSDIAIEAKLSDIAIKSLTYIVNPQTNPTSATQDMARDKYQLGELYFEKGEMKKAEDAWSSFADQDDKFWIQLASEKMKSAQWQDEYKKYLKRIPAAAVGVQ